MTALAEQIRQQSFRPCPEGESKSVWKAMEELRIQQESQAQPTKKKGRPSKADK